MILRQGGGTRMSNVEIQIQVRTDKAMKTSLKEIIKQKIISGGNMTILEVANIWMEWFQPQIAIKVGKGGFNFPVKKKFEFDEINIKKNEKRNLLTVRFPIPLTVLSKTLCDGVCLLNPFAFYAFAFYSLEGDSDQKWFVY